MHELTPFPLKQLLRTALLLGLLASICSLLPLPLGHAQSVNNPPVPCPCSQTYDIAKATLGIQNAPIGSKTVKPNITSTDPTLVTVVPDSEGQIKLELKMPVSSTAGASAPSGSAPTIKVEIGEENGSKTETQNLSGTSSTSGTTTTYTFTMNTLKAKDWKFPVILKVSTTQAGGSASDDSFCFKYKLTTDCRCSSNSCDVTASVSSVMFSIPVGVSGFGDLAASLEAHFDTLPNPGRLELKLVAPPEITTTGDATTGRIDSVTTTSVKAIVTNTPTGTDPLAYTVKLSSDPASPATTEFRTITVESPTAHSLRLTTVFNGHSRVAEWTRTTPPTGGVMWTFTDGNGLSKTELTKTDVDATTREERVKTSEQDPVNAANYLLVSDRKLTYSLHAWGWEQTREAVDPSGANLISTWSYYQTGGGRACSSIWSGRTATMRITPTGARATPAPTSSPRPSRVGFLC